MKSSNMKILLIISICFSVCFCIPGVKRFVENYCLDRPTTFIDGVVLSTQRDIYVFSGDFVSRIETFGRNSVPLLSSDSPKPIKDLWPQMSTQIKTAFHYNNYDYLLKGTQLWKYDPTRHSAPFVINYFKEFPFFATNNNHEIVSIVTEPIIDSNDTAFYIFYAEPIYASFMEIFVYKGNSTEQLTKSKRIEITKSVSDLLFIENLVYDHWKLDNNSYALKSIWFRKHVFHNIIYQQDYQFISLNNTQSNTRIQSIGYNQVWLGCPQPMCFDSTLDTCFAITNQNGENTLIAFRGRHYWNITRNKPPYTDKANLITDLWPGLPPNLDASYYDEKNDEFYFFKDDLYYNFKGKARVQNTIDSKFPGIPSQVDAVFYINHTETLYFFKGDRYFTFAILDKKLIRSGYITDFPGLPNYIDSAYATEQHIFIFKSWYYYQFDAKSFTNYSKNGPRYETFESKTTFLLFNCPRSLYLFSDYYHMDTYLEHFRYLKPVVAKKDNMLKDKYEYQNALSTSGEHVSGTENTESANDTFNATDIGPAVDSDEDKNRPKNSTYLFIVILLFVVLLAIVAVIGLAVFMRRIKRSPETIVNNDESDDRDKAEDKPTEADDKQLRISLTEEERKRLKTIETKFSISDSPQSTQNTQNVQNDTYSAQKIPMTQRVGYALGVRKKSEPNQVGRLAQRPGYSMGVRKKPDAKDFGQFNKEISLKINDMVDDEDDDDDPNVSNVNRKSTEPYVMANNADNQKQQK